MPDRQPRLDYAPPPPLLRRRRVRLAIVLLLLAAAAGAAARWGPEGWRRGRLLYRQRQCLRYEAPPDQVVYDQCPDTAPGLIRRGGEYFAVAVAWSNAVVAGREPRRLAEFRQVAPAALVPARAGAVLFLHERQTPSGASRLVIVYSNDFAMIPAPRFVAGFDVVTAVIVPGTWRTPPADSSAAEPFDISSQIVLKPPGLRVFAGQADPSDPTHFTIRYELDGRPHHVDGWLRESGNVEFKTGG